MAGAIDNTCLSSEYANATKDVGTISILASRSDNVLKWAFPAGNFVSGLFSRGAPYIHEAIGREGPSTDVTPPSNVHADWQIPDGWGFDHSDYLPAAARSRSDAARYRLPRSASRLQTRLERRLRDLPLVLRTFHHTCVAIWTQVHPYLIYHLDFAQICRGRGGSSFQLPATVIPSIRTVGTAPAPRNSRSFPIALTFRNISFRFPAIVISSTACVSSPSSIHNPLAPCE